MKGKIEEKLQQGFELLRENALYVALSVPIYIALTFLLNLLMHQMRSISGEEFNIGVLDFIVPPINVFAVIALAIIADVGIAYYTDFNGHRKVRGKINKNAKGSSRWQTPSEVRKDLVAIPREDLGKAKVAGIPLASDDKYIYTDKETVNSLVIGTTRSGKGQLLVMPMVRLLASVKDKQSMVVNDPKGEIIEHMYDTLMKNGYRIICLNISNPKNSSFYNPLSLIIREYIDGIENQGGDISRAAELAGELANMLTMNDKSDPVWPESAKSLLNAMIMYLLEFLYEQDRLDLLTMPNLYTFFLEYGAKNYTDADGNQRNKLDDLFAPLPSTNPAKLAYATSKFAEGEMRASVFATLSSNLQIFADAGVAMLTSKDEIKFSDLADPERPTAIFMVVPEDKKNRYVLTSLFITQCYSELTAISQKCKGRKLPRRVQFILDEFGNMVKIPDIDVKITVCLGRNMLFNMFVQSLSQLKGRYGENDANTIQGNCGNLIYLQSMDPSTNKTISDMLGTETREVDSFSGDKHNQTSRSSSIESRALMTQDEVPRIDQWHMLVIRQRKFPMHTELPPFYKLGIEERPLDTLSFRDHVPESDEVKRSGDELIELVTNIQETEEERASKANAEAEALKTEELQGVVTSVNIVTDGQLGLLLASKDSSEEKVRKIKDMMRKLLESNKISSREHDLIINAVGG